MSKYIAFDIENLEDIKVAGSMVQSDSEYSISYLSGSAIRGSYIANYINIKGVKDINIGEHKEKLLQGGIKFYNAYPIFDDKRSFPMPKCFYANKEDLKAYDGRKTIKIINHFEEKRLQEDYDKVGLSEFCYLNTKNKVINPVSVKKVSSVHIQKSKDNNKIFRYEAIKKDQKFRTFIQCEDFLVDECKEILEKANFYIGGSKGSGYGRCRIENIEIYEKNPEISFLKDSLNEELEDYFEYEDCEDRKIIYIYFTSDMIYRDKYGVYKTYIDEEFLKEKLGLSEVKFEESFIDTTIISGFNNKWNCHIPHVIGVKAGSVLKYSYKGNLDLDKIEKFINSAVGERTIEGYGSFLILKELPFNQFKDMKITEYSVKPKMNLNKEDKDQLSIILNRIYKTKLEHKMHEKVLKLNETLNLGKGFEKGNGLSSSQWGNLYEIMFIIESEERETGKRKLKEFLEHIDTKKTNRELSHVLKRTRIKVNNKEIGLYEYLKDFCNTCDDVREFIRGFNVDIELAGIEPKVDEDYVYKYNVKVLKELFRLQLKKGGEYNVNQR
ncbi:hypothetical protein ACOAKC_04960 [Hathewaya histolytica]|uniref:hypothetical protein n=1 Tax=Hathewaya histolytica TaxID=1498 RepID=UPI003B683B1C